VRRLHHLSIFAPSWIGSVAFYKFMRYDDMDIRANDGGEIDEPEQLSGIR